MKRISILMALLPLCLRAFGQPADINSVCGVVCYELSASCEVNASGIPTVEPNTMYCLVLDTERERLRIEYTDQQRTDYVPYRIIGVGVGGSLYLHAARINKVMILNTRVGVVDFVVDGTITSCEITSTKSIDN